MGLDPTHFQEEVIEPALLRIGLYSPDVTKLLLYTAIAESGLRALKQYGGPALGVFQIEPATHRDIWRNFLAYRPALAARVWSLTPSTVANPHDLIGHMPYAAAMARLVYRRSPAAIPAADDLWLQAAIWKSAYNTIDGAGKPLEFVERVETYLREGT